MEVQFEFNQQLMPQNVIDVEELGQFAIEAWNDEGYYYYLIVRTLLGTASIASCGPVIPDVEMLPSGFNMSLDKVPYKEDKLTRTVTMWLNDRSKKLTNAKTIEISEAIEQFRDLKEYLKTYSEDTF